MEYRTFKLTIKGDDSDNSVRLNDFIDQLDSIKQALNSIDKRISGKKSPNLYYRIVSIKMNSPITIEVEAVSKAGEANYGDRVISRLGIDLSSLLKGEKPNGADIDLLETYKSLVQPLKKHVSEFTLTIGNGEISVPKFLDKIVDDILGPDQVEIGSTSGNLELLDIHNSRNLFKVYPIIGPPYIKCKFSDELLKTAVAGINRFVEVHGNLHWKKSEKFPHFMIVHSIDILPDQSEIPSFLELRGIVDAEAYEGLSSTEYIEKIRNEEW